MFYARQMDQAELAVQRQQTMERLALFAPVAPCEPLCGGLEQKAGTDPTEDGLDEIEAVSGEERGTKEEAG